MPRVSTPTREVLHIPARPETRNRAATRQHRIRLAAYCRVSTEQEDQLLSFENQKEYFLDYARRHPEYELVDIYPDRGITGTNTRHREEFHRMIADCKAGKIDMVITKSISRFARNTQDCLKYTRLLKDLGIGVVFEKEGINTLDGFGELLFTILSSLAQDESRSISENTTWGIRYLFTQGVLHLNTNRFLGYDKDKDGRLVVNPEQAAIVRRIYAEFMDGNGPGVIARRLREEGVPGVMGEPKWCVSTIMGILRNEKYTGDALLQKTYTADYLSKKTVKNNGEVDQVWVKHNHEAIIPKDLWDIVQMEIERRSLYLDAGQLRTSGRYTDEQPFSTKVFCGKCGRLFRRRTLTRLNAKKIVWMCSSYYEVKGVPGCGCEKIEERALHQAFVDAWNYLLAYREKYLPEWERTVECADENALLAYRAEQLINLTADAEPLTGLDTAIVNKVLERCLVHPDGSIDFFLLDGTELRAKDIT